MISHPHPPKSMSSKIQQKSTENDSWKCPSLTVWNMKTTVKHIDTFSNLQYIFFLLANTPQPICISLHYQNLLQSFDLIWGTTKTTTVYCMTAGNNWSILAFMCIYLSIKINLFYHDLIIYLDLLSQWNGLVSWPMHTLSSAESFHPVCSSGARTAQAPTAATLVQISIVLPK